MKPRRSSCFKREVLWGFFFYVENLVLEIRQETIGFAYKKLVQVMFVFMRDLERARVLSESRACFPSRNSIIELDLGGGSMYIGIQLQQGVGPEGGISGWKYNRYYNSLSCGFLSREADL